MSKEQNTEDKIKEAAKRVFVSKGFAGCSSREIAKEAGMNVALVNYYFRSKNKLFELVFDTVMQDFLEGMIQVFSTDMPLEEKIRIFIEREYDFLMAHPDVPGFIINEITRQNDCPIDKHHMMDKVASTGIFQQSLEAQKRGEMREIDLVSLTMLIMSNCHYPYMAKPLMQELHRLDDDAYAKQLLLHKQYVVEMLINYIFKKNN